MEHKFYRTGSDMSLQDSKFSANVMRNKKNIFYEEDPSKKCRNYPNPDFFSYKECDSKYTRKDRREKIDIIFQEWILCHLGWMKIWPM